MSLIDFDKISGIAKNAGSVIMDIYNRDVEVEFKSDRSPLTEADKKSNEVIIQSLESFYPNIPIQRRIVRFLILRDRHGVNFGLLTH